MYACEMVWEPQEAADVIQQVEGATGLPCPCKRGVPCPFVNVERLTTPTERERLAG